MTYRGEIDGLRAVAILPVVLFHAGFSGFAGGYVGVDVFFVISGYLITSLIMQDMQKGRFSLLDFYERRARRLLPALFLVLAVCCVLAVAWMPPASLSEFSQFVIATSLFVSNIVLWQKTSYFSPALRKTLFCTCGRWRSRSSSISCFRCSCCCCGAQDRHGW